MSRAPATLAILACLTSLGATALLRAEAPRARRPVAIVAAGDRVITGNRSGTISVIDAGSLALVAEHDVAERIADMARIGGSKRTGLLVLDDGSDALRRVIVQNGEARSDSIATLPPGAVKLAVTLDGRRAFVSAMWAREIRAVSLEDGTYDSVTLPFAPRDLLLCDGDRRLVVAGAFSGRLAVIDATAPRLLATRSIRGHNIRDLATDGERLLVAEQRLERTLADYEELHWGRMLSNGALVLSLEDVLEGAGESLDGWLDEHGGIGSALGDPGGVVTGAGGVAAVAFAGAAEVVLRRDGGVATRLPVGERPEAMAIHGGRLWVANRFDDSVTVIDLSTASVAATVSLGEMPVPGAVERGERLFYDARLSHDGWMSCHSCHTDGHAADLLVDTLGDGDYGAPKRVPSLLGTRGTGPWGWTGAAPTLEAQVEKSVATTMHGEALSSSEIADLVAFLESLEPPPALERGATRAALAARGREVFESRACGDCHASEVLTSTATYDVGLTDARGRRKFNPPSLRGVGQRERLFHDARAASIEEVLTRFRHELDEPLAEREAAALAAYLRGL